MPRIWKSHGSLGKKLWEIKENLLTNKNNPSPNLLIENDLLVFRGKIAGEFVDLTKVFFPKDYPAVEADSEENCVQVQHTLVENAAKVMDYVEKALYPAAINENDPEKLTEKLGEIFWWICQAKPWKLGDPSSAELLIRSIWISKGYELPPWKVGVVPWEFVTLEADPKVFAKKFSSFFEWKEK